MTDGWPKSKQIEIPGFLLASSVWQILRNNKYPGVYQVKAQWREVKIHTQNRGKWAWKNASDHEKIIAKSCFINTQMHSVYDCLA